MADRLFVLVLSWLLMGSAFAAETERADESVGVGSQADEVADQALLARQRASSRGLPVYVPRSRGSARSRVGAATRGPRDDLPMIQVLAPDHVAFTTVEQPQLYWYLGAPSSVMVNVTLIDDRSAQPLVDIELNPPVAAGLHRLGLADHAVTLEPDREYFWYSALVPDPQRRSADVIAGGMVRYDPVRGAESVGALAEAGYWYDAFHLAAQEFAATPQDGRRLEVVTSLANQVNLSLDPAVMGRPSP